MLDDDRIGLYVVHVLPLYCIQQKFCAELRIRAHALIMHAIDARIE